VAENTGRRRSAGRARRMTPDAARHDPRPDYLRALLQQAGVSQRAAARRIGISERVMRYYLADESADYRPAPYPVQFAIEALASGADQS
jgi:hypothetical protein